LDCDANPRLMPMKRFLALRHLHRPHSGNELTEAGRVTN